MTTRIQTPSIHTFKRYEPLAKSGLKTLDKLSQATHLIFERYVPYSSALSCTAHVYNGTHYVYQIFSYFNSGLFVGESSYHFSLPEIDRSKVFVQIRDNIMSVEKFARNLNTVNGLVGSKNLKNFLKAKLLPMAIIANACRIQKVVHTLFFTDDKSYLALASCSADTLLLYATALTFSPTILVGLGLIAGSLEFYSAYIKHQETTEWENTSSLLKDFSSLSPQARTQLKHHIRHSPKIKKRVLDLATPKTLA